MKTWDDSFRRPIHKEDWEASVEKDCKGSIKQKGGIIKIRISKNNEVPLDLI